MSSTWSVKPLGAAAQARADRRWILEAHAVFLKGVPDAAGMALFLRHDADTDRPLVYFSPALARLGEVFGATPCEAPRRAGLELIAGDESAWQRLF